MGGKGGSVHAQVLNMAINKCVNGKEVIEW